MTPPSFSIVVPSYNRADLLRRCLASVARHAPVGTEVIVVDDCSSGDSVRTAATAFRGVRLVRLPRRRGFCGAANAGIAAADAAIVELLNDDTEVTAGWAEAALACFVDPRIVAVAPLVLQWNNSNRSLIVDSAGDGYDPGGFARKRGHGEPLLPIWLRRCEVFGASGSSAFYRRDVLTRVGAFPEQFVAYFDDVDLSFRLRRTGGIIVYEPTSRVWHRGGSSHGRLRRRLIEQQSCNEERVFWRNLPGADLARAFPRHLAVLAGKALRRWQEGALLPWLCGRARAWAEIPASRRHQQLLVRLATFNWTLTSIQDRIIPPE
jgi:GT2 family glycosyltransferase